MSKKNKSTYYFDDDYFIADPRLIENPVYVIGKLSINLRGFGFVTADDGGADVFIDREDIGGAIHGDIVKVRIIEEYTGRRVGEVKEILEHVKNIFVGTIKGRKKKLWVEPDDEHFNYMEIFIKPVNNVDQLLDLKKSKTKVVVKINDWKNMRGEIVEILGQKNDHGVGITSILRSQGVFEKFPESVLNEAKDIEIVPSAEEISKRIDRRNLKIVTIDGEDAKDLDDGVFAERIDDGYFLGVYIADVSHYVRPRSALDIEAFERGTSIYPVDRVVPMLPPELSNGICSLNANVDRLAMACEMNIDRSGKITSYKIFPTTIHVFRRLSYSQVNKFYDGETSEIEGCADNLKALLDIYKLRKKILHERGAIDFDIPELKIILDDKGMPIDVVKKLNGIAEGVIEQCMLAANETVAEHTQKKNIPSLYRVHELPTSEKLESLNRLLAHFSLHVNTSKEGDIKPRDIQKILEKIKDNPAEKVISNYALRTMQQARYSPENLGHFGIAAEFYTHFTSPIRRYPDLIVHRMLRASLENPQSVSAYSKNLEEMARQSSERERRAVDIERAAVDMKSTEYMKKFLWRNFDAVICSITKFGFFAELDNGIDGLVHISNLYDDYYEYIESQMMLVGIRSGRKFQIGDNVRVKLIEANVETGKISFELIDNKGRDIIADEWDQYY